MDRDRQLPVLIPQPRNMRLSGSELPVGRLIVSTLPSRLAAYGSRINELAELVGGRPDHPTVLVHIASFDTAPEGYELRIEQSGVRIRASTGLGALHAMRTLVDLWDSDDSSTLPEAEIVDHPTFTVRGVFVESFAGTDRMDLVDWTNFLDRMGQLKLNTVGLSIYGCWDIHHEAERNEYLFTPLKDFPDLKSPQRMVTWDPISEGEVEHCYLPRMFEEDFFGEVARYADKQGIELVPHLGGPGHSTLIPRAVRALSALDERGVPTGYGYCVSSPGARVALTRLVRCLVQQQLVPNRVRRLHVAGDEYYPIRNIDPQDRKRVVSPYCCCVGCGELTPGQMLIEYFIQVGQILAEEGITMVHWQDTLIREGVLDAYLDRVDALGLPRPVIAWWKYNDPTPIPDATRAEAWSCPTTGLASFIFNQDFCLNIESSLRRGYRAGAKGAFAYSSADPSDQMNYAFLAEFAWSIETSGGAAEFAGRWARQICPRDVESASQALSLARTVTACYPLMMYIVQPLLPFFSAAGAGVAIYPDDLLRAFAVVQPPLVDVIRQVADTMRDAASLMPEGRDVRYWSNAAVTWRQQADRLSYSLDLFLSVLAAARRPVITGDEYGELSRKAECLLWLTAASKPAYQAPAALREHWMFIREIRPALERLRKGAGVTEAEPWYAWLI